MRNKVNSPEDGFTLVEIIASIVLLGLVISVFMAIFPQMINWSNSAEKELVSSNLTAKVAHEIYEGKYQGLETTYDTLKSSLKGCTLGTGDYKTIPPTIDDSGKVIPEEINEVEYTIRMEACVNKDEAKDSLMRVHFTITNNKTKHNIDSFAFYKATGVESQ